MNKRTLTVNKLEVLCFGLTQNTDNELRDVLLNNFKFEDIYIAYLSKMNVNSPKDISKLEKFITGLSNCAAAYGKEIVNIATSFLVQPYLYVDFSNELKNITDIVEFYIFVGERIYDFTNNSEGVVKINLPN